MQSLKGRLAKLALSLITVAGFALYGFYTAQFFQIFDALKKQESELIMPEQIESIPALKITGIALLIATVAGLVRLSLSSEGHLTLPRFRASVILLLPLAVIIAFVTIWVEATTLNSYLYDSLGIFFDALISSVLVLFSFLILWPFSFLCSV